MGRIFSEIEGICGDISVLLPESGIMPTNFNRQFWGSWFAGACQRLTG